MHTLKDQTGFSAILLTIILILCIGLSTGLYYLKNANTKQNNATPKNVTSPNVPLSTLLSKTIEIGNEISISSHDQVNYVFPLNSTSNIVVTKKPSSVDGGGFPKGQVVLETGDQKTVLIDDVWIQGAGGNTFTVFTTSDPAIFLLHSADGDMGWYYKHEYYVDINKRAVIFRTKDDQQKSLEFITNDNMQATIEVDVTDKCGEGKARIGKKASINGLKLNNAPSDVFIDTIHIDCTDPVVFGPIYNPNFNLEKIAVAADFTKVYFILKGERYVDDKSEVLWKDDYILDLSDPKNPRVIK